MRGGGVLDEQSGSSVCFTVANCNWLPPSIFTRKLEICEVVVSCIALCKVQNRSWCFPVHKASCNPECRSSGTLHEHLFMVVDSHVL